MERGAAANFTRMGTLGVEEEFYVVDDAGRPASATDELVYETEPPQLLDDRLAHELFKFIIETQSPIIDAPDAAGETVVAVRDALLDHAGAHGFDVAGAGLHPAATWPTLEHATKPRYRQQLDRIQYPQHRNITAGVHVHVGVDDADKAVWVANELRWYLPIILGLSVNSPYWCGSDTGLQSARSVVFESLPNTGMPTAFDSYAEFDAFEATMLEEGAIEDRGELWFDVRPHSEHGTVEVRIPDGQRDTEVVSGIIDYVYALVTDLSARYEDGEAGTEYRRELLDENKWRALRYGHDASLLDRQLETSIPLRSLVEQEADRCDVPSLIDLIERESGASEQRRRYEAGGMDALCDSLLLAHS